MIVKKALLPIILLAGCQSSNTSSGEWVASVNGQKISLKEWEQVLAKASQYSSKDYSQENIRKDTLKELVNKELLFQLALKEKIYEKSLYLKDQIVQEYLRQTISRKPISVEDAEIQDFYNQKKSDFEKLRASHILIKPKVPGDVKSEAEAKVKAEKILSELQAKGSVHFAEYAKKYSEDLSNKDTGGDLKYFGRKDMVPEFSDAAFALKKAGDLSSVVQTSFGYHLILLTEDQRTFESLKPEIQKHLSVMKQKKIADQIIADLRSKASIKIKEALILPKSPEGKL